MIPSLFSLCLGFGALALAAFVQARRATHMAEAAWERARRAESVLSTCASRAEVKLLETLTIGECRTIYRRMDRIRRNLTLVPGPDADSGPDPATLDGETA